ncbi:hypothetical protein Dda_1586 [Drechslerella dactyloides]|uniref:Uncharacterized protein n=1 Tax=Drechslerella dactyloides TaxID=74499 RepID=A0AAD6J223_DREDA|nr:hypothetical protein Dda_1586 [Drechslerella dactyloides]
MPSANAEKQPARTGRLSNGEGSSSGNPPTSTLTNAAEGSASSNGTKIGALLAAAPRLSLEDETSLEPPSYDDANSVQSGQLSARSLVKQQDVGVGIDDSVEFEYAFEMAHSHEELLTNVVRHPGAKSTILSLQRLALGPRRANAQNPTIFKVGAVPLSANQLEIQAKSNSEMGIKSIKIGMLDIPEDDKDIQFGVIDWLERGAGHTPDGEITVPHAKFPDEEIGPPMKVPYQQSESLAGRWEYWNDYNGRSRIPAKLFDDAKQAIQHLNATWYSNPNMLCKMGWEPLGRESGGPRTPSAAWGDWRCGKPYDSPRSLRFTECWYSTKANANRSPMWMGEKEKIWNSAGRNQYAQVYETVFEDHWGDYEDLGYYNYVNDTLYQTISTGLVDQDTAYPINSWITEPITPVDPDPGNVIEPLTSLNATPIFCGHRIMVLLQYQADYETKISVRAVLRQAWRLLAAIRNKWEVAGKTDPVWKPGGTIAIPKKPDSLAGKVYTTTVDFQWGQYLPVKIQVLGRTRFSEDPSEWVILAVMDPNDLDSQCPFTNDALIPQESNLVH